MLPFRHKKLHPCTTSAKGEVTYPRTCRKPAAELAIKGGFLALSPQFLFTALKQIQSHLRTGPLLSWGIREQKLSPRARATNWHSPSGARGDGPCCPLPQCLPTWWVTMARKDLCGLTAPKWCLLRQLSSNLLLCWLTQWVWEGAKSLLIVIWDLLKFYLFKETFIPLLKGSGRPLHGQMAAPVINQFLLTTNILQRWRVTINHYLLLLHDEIVIIGGKHCIMLSHQSSQSCTLSWHLSVKFSEVLNEGLSPPSSLPANRHTCLLVRHRQELRQKQGEGKVCKRVYCTKTLPSKSFECPYCFTGATVFLLTNLCPWF